MPNRIEKGAETFLISSEMDSTSIDVDSLLEPEKIFEKPPSNITKKLFPKVSYSFSYKKKKYNIYGEIKNLKVGPLIVHEVFLEKDVALELANLLQQSYEQQPAMVETILINEIAIKSHNDIIWKHKKTKGTNLQLSSVELVNLEHEIVLCTLNLRFKY